MSVFYIAMDLESFIHCPCGLKKINKAGADSPIFKYKRFSLFTYTNLKSKHLIKIGLLASIANHVLNFLGIY